MNARFLLPAGTMLLFKAQPPARAASPRPQAAPSPAPRAAPAPAAGDPATQLRALALDLEHWLKDEALPPDIAQQMQDRLDQISGGGEEEQA